MGQKVNPIGYRLGVNKEWQSVWYADKDYSDKLIKDIKIREYVFKNLKEAAIASVIIARRNNKTEVTIYTAKPGVIIGRGGEDIEKLRKKIAKLVGEEIYINIVEEKILT
jgi:ribosomal protein S3, bacterial type